MEILHAYGRDILAYELATRTTYPSWGFMIASGATTMWELWQNKTGPEMNSHNHPMFGCVGSWLYRALAGINQAEDSVGFRKLEIRPAMVRDLTFAAASIETITGPLGVSWSREDGTVKMDVTIPFNSTAEVTIPKLGLRDIMLFEGDTQIYSFGKFKTGVDGVTMVDEKDDFLLVKVGSGSYCFRLTGN